MTPTLARGNKLHTTRFLPNPRGALCPRVAGHKIAQKPACTGFTLIELMVVMAIVALSAGLISLALREPAQQQLEREAERLAILFENARAFSRASGQDIGWQAASAAQSADSDFVFTGTHPGTSWPQRWQYNSGLSIRIYNNTEAMEKTAPALVLGPEAIIPAQTVILSQPPHQVRIVSNGLAAFSVQPAQ